MEEKILSIKTWQKYLNMEIYFVVELIFMDNKNIKETSITTYFSPSMRRVFSWYA